MEIKWTDTDPVTGERRFVRAERFARQWRFTYRSQRRGVWTPGPAPTRAMWEHVLAVLERSYRRRHGVSDDDIAQVKRILSVLPEPDPDDTE